MENNYYPEIGKWERYCRAGVPEQIRQLEGMNEQPLIQKETSKLIEKMNQVVDMGFQPTKTQNKLKTEISDYIATCKLIGIEGKEELNGSKEYLKKLNYALVIPSKPTEVLVPKYSSL